MLSRSLRSRRRFSIDKPDSSKSTTRLIGEELANNPMFDRAFPHLAGYKDRTTSDLPKEELGFIKSLL
jgi:hypothetical protein